MRTRPIDARSVRQRAEQARDFLDLADRVSTDDSPVRTNIVGSLCVLAGIAAADAICGRLVGERSVGENHADAVRLLDRATPPTSRAAGNLRRLLAAKTDTQYGTDLVGESTAGDLLRAAQRLVDEMERVLSP